DGQMDPAELADVVAPVVAGRAGYVKGHRLHHPEVWRRMPWIRLLGNATLGALTSLAIGVRIGDAQCGFTAASREALEALDLDGLWPGYGYPNDLLGALTRAGVTVAEVPVSPIYAGESSGLRPRHFAVMLWLIGRAGYRRAQLLRRKKAANAAR
ncbi:MAG: glycosyltransferase family 2 protein, partial [Myxococcales bacterium]|nr:glycosyltransferase family 2 protein [Myxococcales bacterium]